MNESLRDSIITNHPKLYRHGISFECLDGWLPIIQDLSGKIEPLILNDEDEYRHIYAVQVKEKYGGLRFYMSVSNDAIDKLIDEAEEACAITCERCGKPGELTGTRWYQTLCKECYGKTN